MRSSNSFSNNESYPQSANLTDEQREYDRIWSLQRDIRNGRVDMPYMCIGIKAKPQRQTGHGRGRAGKSYKIDVLRPECLIRHPSTLTLVSISTPIPSEHWVGASSRSAYRFNAMEQSFYTDEGGVLCAGGAKQPGRILQYDLAKNPLQDYPQFSHKHFDPNSVGAAAGLSETTANSPFAGDFRIVRDELYLNLCVRNHIVFRFDKRDADALQLTEERFVQKGDTLVTLIGKVTYGAAELRNEQPIMVRISGDVLPASRKRPLFRMYNQMLGQMTQLAVLPPGNPRRPQLTSPSQWAPVPLALFSSDVFATLRVLPDWKVSDFLKQRVLHAVGPMASMLAQLCIKAPAAGHITAVTDHDMYKVISIRSEGGEEHEVRTPVLAKLFPHTHPGNYVNKGEALADWCDRRVYENWQDLDCTMEGHMPWLVDAYLQMACVQPGESGWEGNGVLIDARLVEPVLANVEDWYVDLRPCQQYLDLADGFIVFPPLRNDAWDSFSFTANGISYSLEPAGNQLTETPVRKESAQAHSRA